MISARALGCVLLCFFVSLLLVDCATRRASVAWIPSSDLTLRLVPGTRPVGTHLPVQFLLSNSSRLPTTVCVTSLLYTFRHWPGAMMSITAAGCRKPGFLSIDPGQTHPWTEDLNFSIPQSGPIRLHVELRLFADKQPTLITAEAPVDLAEGSP